MKEGKGIAKGAVGIIPVGPKTVDSCIEDGGREKLFTKVHCKSLKRMQTYKRLKPLAVQGHRQPQKIGEENR